MPLLAVLTGALAWAGCNSMVSCSAVETESFFDENLLSLFYVFHVRAFARPMCFLTEDTPSWLEFFGLRQLSWLVFLPGWGLFSLFGERVPSCP